MICRSQPYVQVENKLSKSNCAFSIPHTVTSPTCAVTVVIIIIIYGMSIVTKYHFIYNNRLT